MRLFQISICFAILGVLAVGTFGQTDPQVIINHLGDPVCTTGGTMICFDGSTADHPLVEDFQHPMSFVYTSPAGTTDPLTTLFIELMDYPSLTQFQCLTNIWTDCAQTPDQYGVGTVGFELFGNGTGLFDGGGGTCGIDPASPCADQMVNNESATFTIKPLVVVTPEPGSVILFGTGLLSVFLTAKRRLSPSASV
jgi:hypothetical protein